MSDTTTPTPEVELSDAETDMLFKAWLDNDVSRGIEWLTPVVARIVADRLAGAVTTTEWNVLDDGEPYLQPWPEDEDEARDYSNCVTGPLVHRTRTRIPDRVGPTLTA